MSKYTVGKIEQLTHEKHMEAAKFLAEISAWKGVYQRMREALEEIATGRNKAGEKVDFPQDIARKALADLD